jgi:hypothetical protein
LAAHFETSKGGFTMDELVYDLAGQNPGNQFVSRASDPLLSPAASTPGDFAAQFPQPLDTTELVVMCEELGMWKALPEKPTSLKSETWRELSALAFASGSSYLAFADGACPEEYYHSGSNSTVDLKNIGAHKSLTISDIMHSAAVSAMSIGPYGVGINRLIGGFEFSEGMPGGSDSGAFLAEAVSDLKAKEMVLAGTMVLNGWDTMLVTGNKSNNALTFDGIETILTAANGAHTDSTSSPSGTFSASTFDRFLAEGCAKPTALAGHPQAIQELMSAYFQLGFQGSQLIYNDSGNRLVPGFNFAGEVNTGIGTLKVIADRNFTKTAAGSTAFQSKIFALRLVHNGEPLVYKMSQIPLSFRDLVPGCTAIQFQIWAKTALIIKAACAHGFFQSLFNGRVVTTCPTI